MKIRMFTLPNIITLANLACGCAALVVALKVPGNIALSFWLLVAAAIFDFADGMTARLTGQYSELGVQLDSLADMVSFGVAPSAILFAVYRDSFSYVKGVPVLFEVLGWLVFVVALFSALRLARFNIDGSQSTEFRGLPTPAAALAIAALGWLVHYGYIGIAREIVLVIAGVVSYLLVCPVRMFSLKFHNFYWRGNALRYLFIASSAVLVAVFRIGGIPMAVVLYIVISTVRYLYLRRLEKF